MSLIYKEVGWRVFYCRLAVLVAGGVGFVERSVYIFTLCKPALDYSDQILYSRPGEALRLALERAGVIGFVVSIPYFVLQVLAFVRPGLRPYEWRRCLALGVFVSRSWLVAVLFSLEVLLGQLRKVLVDRGQLEAEFGRGFRLRAEEYIPWALKYMFRPGVLVQAPLMFRRSLKDRVPGTGTRKLWLGASLVVGGVLSPPDLLLQLGITLPVRLYRELRVLVKMVFVAYTGIIE